MSNAPPGPGPGQRKGPPGSPGAGLGAMPQGVQITKDMRGMPDGDDKLWATGAHIAGMLAPVAGPLAMWFLKKDESEFIAYHCAQAMWWSVITWVVSVLLTVVTCGAGSIVFPLFWLGSAYVALEAKEGNWHGYWFIHSFGYHRKLV